MSHDTTPAANPTTDWDQQDPHGINPHHGQHHHFVADWRMQVTVLIALLGLTVVTVLFYNAEAWVESAFEIDLPGWVNIAGVMTVATLKALLVAAFFMQLRYDKLLNTFVLLFCLLCVALFLTLSMIDLGSRDLIYKEKAGEILRGGTGYGLDSAPASKDFSIKFSPKVNTQGIGLVYESRLVGNEKHPGLNTYREDPNLDEGEFWAEFYAGHATHRDMLDEHNYFESLGFGHNEGVSNANKSRPRRGLTPGLFSDVAPAGGHGAAGTPGSQDEHGQRSH